MLKTIIRIEYPLTGDGLWTARTSTKGALIELLSFYYTIKALHEKMNTPHADGYALEANEYCAFKSIDHLLSWVKPSWLDEIIDVGFVVYELQVLDWVELDTQIIFKKKNIVTKTILNINDLKLQHHD